MRLLLANPNTTQAVTDTIAAAARACASPGTEIVAVTARFGARVIGTRAEMAVAEHASLDLMAAHAPGCDAVIVGASTDSGLRAGREALAVPVLGLTESALHVACLTGGRFGALTLSQRSGHALRDMIDGYGFAGRCAAVRVVDATPLQLLEQPDAVGAMLAEAAAKMAEEGCDVLVLVGAVMAAMAARVQPQVPVPVIEGVSCAVALAEALVRLRLPKAASGGYAGIPPRQTVGLGGPLAAMFTRGTAP